MMAGEQPVHKARRYQSEPDRQAGQASRLSRQALWAHPLVALPDELRCLLSLTQLVHGLAQALKSLCCLTRLALLQ